MESMGLRTTSHTLHTPTSQLCVSPLISPAVELSAASANPLPQLYYWFRWAMTTAVMKRVQWGLLHQRAAMSPLLLWRQHASRPHTTTLHPTSFLFRFYTHFPLRRSSGQYSELSTHFNSVLCRRMSWVTVRLIFAGRTAPQIQHLIPKRQTASVAQRQ